MTDYQCGKTWKQASCVEEDLEESLTEILTRNEHEGTYSRLESKSTDWPEK